MFRTKITRYIATVLSVFLVAGVVTPLSSSAQTPNPYAPIVHLEDAFSYGYGGMLDLRLLEGYLTVGENGDTLTVAELSGVEQLWESFDDDSQLSKTGILDLDLLEDLIYLDLNTIHLPLIGKGGILDFAQNSAAVGLLKEIAHAPSATQAFGAAGAVSDTGTIEVTQPGSGENATIDLLSLLRLQESGVLGVDSTIIEEASISLGALSSTASASKTESESCTSPNSEFDISKLEQNDLSGNATVLNSIDKRICSGYQIADAIVKVKAPIVGDIVSNVETLLNGVGSDLNALLGNGGLLDRLEQLPFLGSVLEALGNVEATVTLPVDKILEELVEEPLQDDAETISIDLVDGTISIDLAKISNRNGLNGLDPNTPLLSGNEIESITSTIGNLLTEGLVDRLEGILSGDNGQGGLYATKVDITLTTLGLVKVELAATLGGLLNPDVKRASTRKQFEDFPYDYYLQDGVILEVLFPIVKPILAGVGSTIAGLLSTTSSLINGVLGTLESQAPGSLVYSLIEALRPILDPIASILINRQTLTEVEHGAVFTVSALEIGVLNGATSSTHLLHLPIATSAVLAQTWEPIGLHLNVAKIGDGRKLHNGGYSYDLVCKIDDAVILEKSGTEEISYPDSRVGTAYEWQSNSINLLNATQSGGLTETIRIPPEAVCEITAIPSLASEDFSSQFGDRFAPLRPTGSLNNEDRTPYSYFITSESGLSVSGAIDDQSKKTLWSSINDLTDIDVSNVNDDWKNHSLSFSIPANAPDYTVNIVHAYDVDTRDITVFKKVEGTLPPTSGPFEFEYSLDGGTNWTTAPAIADGGSFPITGVPLIDSDLNETQIQIREKIDAPNNGGPDVSWVITNTDPFTTLTSNHDGTYSAAQSFSAALGITAASTTTPILNLTATNAYPIEVDFEAMLPKTGRTSLVWVIGLGLLAALGALIMFVRSRKK